MSSSIFNSGKEKIDYSEKIDIHSKTLITIVQRQKDIESSLDNLHEKIDMVDHNTVKDFKKAFNEIKHLRNDLLELKSEFKKLKDIQEKTVKQLKLLSPKDEVKKLEKYIDLWEPLQFVTREEMKKNQKETIEKLTKVIEDFLKE
jgi:hypothetical protein